MSMKKFLSVAAAVFASSLSNYALSQTASPGLGVYDADNKYVGNLIDLNRIWIKFPDGEAYFSTDASGALTRFRDPRTGGYLPQNPDSFYYTTPDCSGTRYLGVKGLPARGVFMPKFEANPVAVSGDILYAKKPYERIIVRSSAPVDSQVFRCAASLDYQMLAGRVGSVKVLGLKQPFTIR